MPDAAYEISRPTGVCAATGRPIVPGQPFVAVLLEGADERLQRRDYTPDAWTSEATEARRLGGLRVIGFWRGVMPEAGAARRRFIDDEALTDLFEQLGEGEPDPRRAAFRYVLALILVRKRLLRLEPAPTHHARPGPRPLVLRWPKAPPEQPPIIVPDPGMTEDAVTDVIEQLGAVIGPEETGKDAGTAAMNAHARLFGSSSVRLFVSSSLCLFLCSSLLLCLSACRTAHQAPTGPLPAYADLARMHNARLDSMSRLWARAVTVARYPGKDGKEESIQAEGHFQYIAPRSLLLTFDKVGLQKTFAVLGSSPTHYWWIDLLDERVMSLGTHERATPEAIARMGLPMHPLALLDAAALTPLPNPAGAGGPVVSWSKDGLAVVTIERDGRPVRRVYLAPQDAMPRRVELLDSAGRIAATAALSAPREVEVPFPQVRPLFPSRHVIDAEDDQGRRIHVQINLHDMDTTRRQPRPQQFDPAALAEQLGVERIVDADQPPAPPAPSPGPPPGGL